MNVIPWVRHTKLDIYILFDFPVFIPWAYRMNVIPWAHHTKWSYRMNVIPWARHTKLDIYVLFWLSSIYTMVVPDECYSMSASY